MTEQKSISKLIALGSNLADHCDTTKQVRDYCRAKNMARAKEAYVVEGFRRARIAAGLSECV